MTEGSSSTLTVDAPAIEAPDRIVSALKAFAAGHGGATAVVEYVGRRGARIVLVGKDGVWGDQFADDTDVARRACELAEVPIENSWERELVESMTPTNDLWRSMSRRLLAH
ncbi:hypothetical protein GCM10010123_08620 [Pilimelia anulata]|uniref:Uncharacterized protein n=1 Tax=Pilimelia anulata TaxID=53371 RepID=A0A8J3FB76_9ACTN|nr:hypothetical protein [Pilimelia anulata]GGJ81103.1 hypothetical protein GCM10010123_08620 [Pilimelia anulata]